MKLSKRYQPQITEPQLQQSWEERGIYHFSVENPGPVYAIDTPPATVSGHLHLGHAYSYSQTDFLVRFWRMNGYNVYYPMGYDDNGLPTERYVERSLGVSASHMGREAFAAHCIEIGAEAGQEYEALWRRLALSVDWRYTYRTIEDRSRRIAQLSFLDLYHKGLAYRRQSPTIWCPLCRTAIAQAELDDLERESNFFTLAFQLQDGTTLPIATTRPELLPACVAIFYHPDDARFRPLAQQLATVPLFGQQVPLLADPAADPTKGTGAVMCCTFGDVTDVQWWHTHRLPLIQAIGPDGLMTLAAGDLAGLSITQARRRVLQLLRDQSLLLNQQPIVQSVRVHERCDTPAEYMITPQWFIRVMDFKDQLLQAGEQIAWHPPHMQARYMQWVENLSWDWCISRQRAFGVPFPVWYCRDCGEIAVAQAAQLPLDPEQQMPCEPCTCGCTAFVPEWDVMDTWATSSMTPQIAGRWPPGGDHGEQDEIYSRVFPMSLRPQAHDIIRTWAFYTIVKSLHHFGTLPWSDIAISGWGIAAEGKGKISKSRGGGPMPPMEMIERYSADAVRYWTASTGLGKDAVINEAKIQIGAKLVNKLWNLARFSQRFLAAEQPKLVPAPSFSPADRWILSRTQQLVRQATHFFRSYDYAAAKSETESFMWTEFADNYLEMAKMRLYDPACATGEGARWTLYHVLLTVIKLFAPLLPHVTEAIYLGLFAQAEGHASIHHSSWPVSIPELEDEQAQAIGSTLVEIATAVRRYKSEHNLPLGTELGELVLAPRDPSLTQLLQEAAEDLQSITRAQRVQIARCLDRHLETILVEEAVAAAIIR
jgi:valyl-tRNA synthetase